MVDACQHIRPDGDLGVVEHRFTPVFTGAKVDDSQHHPCGAQVYGQAAQCLGGIRCGQMDQDAGTADILEQYGGGPVIPFPQPGRQLF